MLWVWLTSNQKLPSPHLIVERQKGTPTLLTVTVGPNDLKCQPQVCLATKRWKESWIVYNCIGPSKRRSKHSYVVLHPHPKNPSCWPLLVLTELLEESPSWPILPWAVQLLYEVLGKRFLSIPWCQTWSTCKHMGNPNILNSTFDGEAVFSIPYWIAYAQQSTTSLFHLTCLCLASQFIKIIPLSVDSQNMCITHRNYVQMNWLQLRNSITKWNTSQCGPCKPI